MIIRALRSDRESFRTLRFKDGANVVLADRTPDSSQKDAGNGLGKSTMLEIVRFCLGGGMGETLKRKEVKEWTFTIDAEHGGRAFSVSRSTGDSMVEVSGDTAGWPVRPVGDGVLASDGVRINAAECAQMLGRLLYGIEPRSDLRYKPTFGSLIAYRVRQGGVHGGYYRPFQSYRAQGTADVQVNNAYMLGLDRETGSRLRELGDRKKELRDIEKAMSGGLLSDMVGSIGDLEAVLIRPEDRARSEKAAIGQFRVHDRHGDLESEANRLTGSIHGLANERFMLTRRSGMYKDSLREEDDATPEQVIGAYGEAGVLFPDAIRTKLEEVRAFHIAVVRNRRDFLGSEIEKIDGEISQKSQRIDELGAQRQAIMATLQAHGAIDELVRMQERHSGTLAEQADAANRLAQLKKIGEDKTDIDAGMSALRKDAAIDFDERRGVRKKAIPAFNNCSKQLYNAPGKLVIDINEGLYRFNADIEGPGSGGTSNMEIFCYDMMLAGLWAGRPASPGFLVHDSDLFEGVDSGQTAKAIELAADESGGGRFQYICAMNTDDVPRDDFGRGFDFDSLVAATLTDKEAGGGLLGRITEVGDSFITMEIARGMEVRVQRTSISALMHKGTIK